VSSDLKVGFHEKTGLPGLTSELAEAAVKTVWELFDGPLPAQVDVVVIGMEEHCRLHEEFLSDPTPTDVMAFPYADKDLFGEIIVNSDMALLQAPLQKQSALAEMTLYIVHGALHLLGFDDTSVPSREKMRAAEQKVVEKLRKQI
jgi:rRNA maturation RNase YbeY